MSETKGTKPNGSTKPTYRSKVVVAKTLKGSKKPSNDVLANPKVSIGSTPVGEFGWGWTGLSGSNVAHGGQSGSKPAKKAPKANDDPRRYIYQASAIAIASLSIAFSVALVMYMARRHFG